LDAPVAWFSDADLRELAGARSYERGAAYLDAVAAVDEVPGGVVATVHGTETYQVRLRDHGGLTGDCSCPYGQDGAFCKHCVAVGLTLLAGPDQAAAEPSAGRPSDAPDRARGKAADLRRYLDSLDRTELAQLLYEHANEDPVLYRRLSLRAAASGDEVDLPALRRLVDGLRARGFVDYNGSFAYAGRAGDVLDTLAGLLPAHAATAGPLLRRALERIVKASERMDDSSGAVGDAAAHAVELYAGACAAAPPDPVKLAHWLIDFQLDGPGWPDLEVEPFRAALAEPGMAAYRARLDELHAALPAGTDRFDHRRFTVTHLREGLARAEGDVDRLVAILAEDLSEPYRYVRIGEVLREAGRPTEAIAWVERGIRDASRPDRRLDDLLAELYHATGRGADALEARKRSFTSRPELSAYDALRRAARHVDAWPDTRGWALDILRAFAARGPYAADSLIAVLLDEDDPDAAWAAGAEFGGSPGVRLQLADLRARTHPEDAIPVYTAAVETAIERRDAQAYQEAARLLGTLKALHARAGDRFDDYVEGLKETHRRKTRFLSELARARL
jgi:tetratricopeptide (TPR) repeat protein